MVDLCTPTCPNCFSGISKRRFSVDVQSWEDDDSDRDGERGEDGRHEMQNKTGPNNDLFIEGN